MYLVVVVTSSKMEPEAQSLLRKSGGSMQRPPAYVAPASSFCSVEMWNGPYPDSEATWYRYGSHGGAWNNLSDVHNKGYVLRRRQPTRKTLLRAPC